MPSRLVTIGGKRKKENEDKKFRDVYCSTGENLTSYKDLPEGLFSHCAQVCKNHVYCIGGVLNDEEHNISKSVWRLNLNDKQPDWVKIDSMMSCRRDMGATVFKDAVVVTGGIVRPGTDYSKPEYSSSGEFYRETEGWKPIQQMMSQRYGHSLVTCNGCIYAIGGGKDCNTSLKSVEQLSDLGGEWKEVASMNTARKWLAAVSYEGFIYAIGGESGGRNSKLKTVEKYDPNKDEWLKIEDEMLTERSQHTATELDSKIYIVGGVSNITKVVELMECFYPRSNKRIGDFDKNTPHKLHLHSTVAW